MPYVRKGKCVYQKDTGKKVGCSGTTEKAKKYLTTLQIKASEEEESMQFEKVYRQIMESINEKTPL
jgi:hypothetical protein